MKPFAFLKKRKVNIDKSLTIPEHIAIIMDGNGRWAKKRGLARSLGHMAGADNLRDLSYFCFDIGVKILTVYAFSTENWKRPQGEIDALMDLFSKKLDDIENLLGGRHVAIRFIGEKQGLSEKLIQKMEQTTRNTEKYFNETGCVFNFAVNYGGRQEIVSAVQNICDKVSRGELKKENITEKIISENIYTYDIKDPDLIIRPSGELRTSNFLVWQSAYSEFYFSNILWPDFKCEHLMEAIKAYNNRERRFGGIK